MSFKKGHIPWHKGRTNVYTKETLLKMSQRKLGHTYLTGHITSEETKDKIRKSNTGKHCGQKNPMYGRRGELAPGWKGGKSRISAIIRRSYELSEWRKAVFERDNYTCQKCANKRGNKYDGNKVTLEAHHRVPIRNLIKTNFEKYIYNINNGVTLCKPCHELIPKK